jgi:hypothetical protein
LVTLIAAADQAQRCRPFRLSVRRLFWVSAGVAADVRATIVFLGIVLGACAHQPSQLSTDIGEIPAPEVEVGADGNYWWYARFEMDWGEGQRPDFSQNLIVAHEVIAPVLARHSDQILLWRFHRRARHDAAGHQFSFIFFSTPQAARTIYDDISSNPVVESLLKSGNLIALKIDDTSWPHRAGISATSDASWPEPIQNSWPYFIMGVSLMWLDLVEQEVDPDELGSRRSISARLEYYREIEEQITALWKRVGRHALFHHINAIYGYEPLEMVF